ncbi:MAG: hypothetical protein P1U68_16285, partial [Verrucomicrobiales bacterium]|nr:hypothetical protein [Verrucomicrobiales bacterium]
AGTGNINLFAGWDGTGEGALVGAAEPTDVTTFDGVLTTTSTPGAGDISFADIEAGTFGTWGNNYGNVIINGAGTGAVSVGSALGETNAFGGLVFVSGGDADDRFGQLGFRPNLSSNVVSGVNTVTGDINVRAVSHIIVSAILGDTSGGGRNDSHAMIGHGGSDSTAQGIRAGDGDLSGDISVVSESGGIFLQGGNDRSFAMIGHGGHTMLGAKEGDIEVTAEFLDMRGSYFTNGSIDNPASSGATIGHGGYASHGDIGNDGLEVKGFSGDITVNITGSVFGSAGNTDAANLNGSILQIGHGGYFSGIVDQNAGISDASDGGTNTNYLRDPTGYVSTANAGSDSESLSMNLDLPGHSGDVIVNVGGDFEWNVGGGNNAGGQIGHGGNRSHGNHYGNVEVTVGGDFSMMRDVLSTYNRNNDSSPYQIGHGGNRTAGAFSGNIMVDVGGSLEMHGGDGGSYVQIGHGGYNDGRNNSSGADVSEQLKYNQRNAHATLSGNIYVTVGGDFEMYSGSGDGSAYSMVGHGGINRVASGIVDGVLIDEELRGHHGNISMEVGGSITMQASPEDPGMFTSADGDQSNAGDNNFTQIGHGGIRSSGDHYGEIQVEAGGDFSIEAGNGGFEVYNGTNYNGNQTGNQSYAMVGHGGLISHLFGAADTSSVFIQDNGNREGVGFGVITNNMASFAGREDLDAAITNSNITVSSGGDVEVTAMQELGGFRSDQATAYDAGSGDPAIPAVSIRGSDNFAMIGHGGRGDANNNRDPADGTQNLGDITVVAEGDINITAGGVNQDDNPQPAGNDDQIQYNYAQIGHGGNDFESEHHGEIVVDAGGDITLKGGQAYREPARIGHGGFQAGKNGVTNFVTGAIEVTSGGSITMTGGDGTNVGSVNSTQSLFTQIGHGIGNRISDIDADITVTAALDLTVQGGQGYQDSYSHIGHGSLNNADGDFSGTIDVTAGRNILLKSTTGITVTDDVDHVNTAGDVIEAADGSSIVAIRNYAKIGHGDTDSVGRSASTGTWNGDIFVKAGNDLTSEGGMIGHADPTDGDTFASSTSGDTYIAVGRNDPTGNSGDLILGTDVAGNETVITSSGFGLNGELRFYLPTVANNAIEAGTIFNDPSIVAMGAYTRTPEPSGTRADEQLATEFTFSYDADGLPSGDFTPEGVYETSVFGFYTIYYADATNNVIGGGGGGGGVSPVTPFDFLPYFGSDQFEVYDRGELFYGFDGYDGQLFSFGLGDVLEDESDPAAGNWFLEEVLDANLGSRKSGDIADDPSVIEQERDEELERRKAFAARQAGRGGASYYVYDPATNRYSSYRVFGVPQTSLSTAQ